jgi:hypothetical protein
MAKITGTVLIADGVADPTSVLVTLSGDASDTTNPNASGYYEFTGVANGAYVVTPTLADYEFTPASIDVTVAGGVDEDHKDFDCLPEGGIYGDYENVLGLYRTDEYTTPVRTVPMLWYKVGTERLFSLEIWWGLENPTDKTVTIPEVVLAAEMLGDNNEQGKEAVESGWLGVRFNGGGAYTTLDDVTTFSLGSFYQHEYKTVDFRLYIPPTPASVGMVFFQLALSAGDGAATHYGARPLRRYAQEGGKLHAGYYGQRTYRTWTPDTLLGINRETYLVQLFVLSSDMVEKAEAAGMEIPA